MPRALSEIEGEAIGWTQPVRPRSDWTADRVSLTSNLHDKRSTYLRLNYRTVAEIQRKVVKHGKRNAVLRFILANSDRDKIAAWKEDLFRVLQVFNVRSLYSVEYSQT
jgi:hypothetical protein